MIRKSIFLSTIILALNLFAFAQTGQFRGVVELQDGDKKVPYAGAVVEAYRMDVKQKLPTAKTDKKGIFGFVGVQLGGTYTLAISGPDIEPTIYPNIKADKIDIAIVVVKGSGKKLSEEEVKQRATSTGQAGGNAELTAEQKKKMAEEQKAYDEAKVKRDSQIKANETMEKAYNEALKAYNEKNYELAIAKADEGVAAVPDYAGSTSVALNLKANALKDRGYISYANGTKTPASKAELFQTAKKDWDEAIAASKQGIKIINDAIGAINSQQAGSIAPLTLNSSGGVTPEERKNYETTRIKLYFVMTDIYRLMAVGEVDQSRAEEAKPVFEDYLLVETEQPKKVKGQQNYADVLRKSGDCSGAIPQYRKLLELSVDNPDGLAGLGLCLFADGVVKKEGGGDKATVDQGKAMMQEGLNVLTKFAEIAPDTHPLKQNVKETVEYLKTTEKLAPQKAPAKGKKP